MDNFKDLLKLYSQKLNSSQLMVDEIVSIINQHGNLKISKSNIVVRDEVVFCKVSPKQKLEIVLNKEKIISSFQKEGIKISNLK